MFTLTETTTFYEIPGDREAALAMFLSLVKSPGDTWVSAYGFTLAPLVDEILAADAAGVAIHLLLDHTQSTGPAEAQQSKRLMALQHGDVTITTSPVAHQIWHDKATVVAATDGDAAHCWWGSVNSSPSGFEQGNLAAYLRSEPFATAFVARFVAQRDWARANEPQYQMRI